ASLTRADYRIGLDLDLPPRVCQRRDGHQGACRPCRLERAAEGGADGHRVGHVGDEHATPHDVAYVSAERLDVLADQLEAAVCLFARVFLDRAVGLDPDGTRDGNRVADADRAGEADLFLERRKRRDALAAVRRVSHDDLREYAAPCPKLPPVSGGSALA